MPRSAGRRAFDSAAWPGTTLMELMSAAPSPCGDRHRRDHGDRRILEGGDGLGEFRFRNRSLREDRLAQLLQSEAEEVRCEWVPTADDRAAALGLDIDQSHRGEI